MSVTLRESSDPFDRRGVPVLAFFQCVAQAVVEHGVKGLAGMVPGGAFAYDVAEAALKKYRQRAKDDEIRAELQHLSRVSFEEARREAVAAAREAVGGGEPSVELELYLAQIPAAVQQSLKRPQDPSGHTVPTGFSLTSPADVLRLLPPRPPRFRPGDPLPGVPGWVLDRVLGVGGFGEVWLARHPHMASLAGAVKFCHGQQAGDLRHEGGLIDRVMGAGEHPNIVRLRDARLDADPPWLMYEYVAGGDLADWVRQLQRVPGDLRVKQSVAALRQLAGAVGHFHRLTPPVVHRDLKPSNILLDKVNRRLRVTDFGIGAVAARAALDADAAGSVTRGGRMVSSMRGSHTPLYASPQQRTGADPDPRDDVHALGVIGYQLVTGHLDQGAGPDFADDLREHGAPEALISLLGQCVAQRPDRRPADADALAAALSRLGTEAPPVPPTPPAPPAPPPPVAAMAPTPTPQTPPDLPPPPPAVTPSPAAPVTPTAPSAPSATSAPDVAADGVSAEEAVAILEREGGRRLATAQAGSRAFDAAADLRFYPCRCSWAAGDYGGHDFAARTKRGAVTYIGLSTKTGGITCGAKGYHSHRPDEPLCIPGGPAEPADGRPRRSSTRIPIAVPGKWRGRKARRELGYWLDRGVTPGSVVVKADEVYQLQISPAARTADLAGLSALAGQPFLHGLSAADAAAVADADLAPVAGMTALRELTLDGTGVAGLDFCRPLSALQVLRLSGTQVTDASLANLSGLSALRTLDLYGCPGVTGTGVRHLAGLPVLQWLNLSHTRLGDHAIDDLIRLRSLKTIESEGTLLTEAGRGRLEEAMAAERDRALTRPDLAATPWHMSPTGLETHDEVVGAGPEALPGGRVQVHYTGWLTDGDATIFDSSVARGEPIEFGLDEVILGWADGIPGMKPGGVRVLRVPPELAYGKNGAGGLIGPDATLVFRVELLSSE